MSEIKEVYVIEWMGPYNSLDEMYEREGIDSCCIYLKRVVCLTIADLALSMWV